MTYHGAAHAEVVSAIHDAGDEIIHRIRNFCDLEPDSDAMNEGIRLAVQAKCELSQLLLRVIQAESELAKMSETLLG